VRSFRRRRRLLLRRCVLRGRGLCQGSLLLWRGCRRRRRLGWLALGDGGPAGIDDLHPAALVGERILLVLELLLAEADHRKPAFIDLVSLDQEGLHRRGAALRQRKIVLVAALGIGMTGDQEGAACKLGIGQGLAELIERRLRMAFISRVSGFAWPKIEIRP
jgi:hypothetical protein